MKTLLIVLGAAFITFGVIKIIIALRARKEENRG